MTWKPIPTEILQLFGVAAVDADAAPILLKASPVVYIKSDMPPFLLMHGSKDEDVPYAQSVEMCSKMKQAGARCDLITIEGAPHGTSPGCSWVLWYRGPSRLAKKHCIKDKSRTPVRQTFRFVVSCRLLRKSVRNHINPEADLSPVLRFPRSM
jgi:acetyl esterase/lipase